MFSLMWKDLVIQKKTVIFLIGYIFFFIFVTSDSSNIPSIYITGVTVGYFLSIGGFMYDEKSKGNMIINSLPIKKSYIIISKYLEIILFSVASTILMIIVVVFLKATNMISDIDYITINELKLMICSIIGISSISLPILIKLGYKKGNVVFTLLYMTFYFLSAIFKDNYNEEPLKTIISIVRENTGSSLSVLGFVIIFLIFVSSFFISKRLYMNSDIG